MSGVLDARWHRVADLAPRVRAHATVHRHVARGQVWYVLQDNQSGRYFQISPAANMVLCLMDGRRTMAEIWDLVAASLGSARPTREEALRLLIQLYQSDLLLTELPPDMAELARRAKRQDRARWRSWFGSPMAMRFPLLDPDRFLTATLPLARPFFSRAGFVAWFGLVVVGIVLAGAHWAELTTNVSDRVFSTYNVLMLLVLYPISKLLHELGHAYATRLHGGEVHETGLMLLVLYPVPYVDASASSGFADKRARIVVSAAGIMVEVALAALAVIAWVALEPGFARAAAFNLILLCGVSTVLFNGNPLLRFDGYYVLSDWLEVHNLDQRSRRYLLYLLQRHGFGLHDAESPVRAPGEEKILASYGMIAFFYRIGVMLAIAVAVAQQFFVLGVILAIVSVAQMIVWPILRGLRYLATAGALRHRRRRAVAVVGGAVGACLVLLLGVPLPYAHVAQGVAWLPEDAVVHARADGFVTEILVQSGHPVSLGQPVIVQRDPIAQARVEVLRAQAAVADSRFDAVNLIDLTQARLAGEQRQRAHAVLANAEERTAHLTLRAPRDGQFVLPDADRLVGRFVRHGDVVGYVMTGGDFVVRAIVPQAEIDLVRGRTRAAAMRFNEDIHAAIPGVIIRETPSALERPPAATLTADGGGPMLLDPASPRRERPLDRWYEVVIRATGDVPPQRLGARVFVRFDLGSEALGWRLLRTARQLLPRLLNA